MQLEEYFRRQKYPEEYPSSSTPSPDGEQDEVSDNPLDRTFKSSITTEDTSDEDFDAGRYSTPQGRKVRIFYSFYFNRSLWAYFNL